MYGHTESKTSLKSNGAGLPADAVQSGNDTCLRTNTLVREPGRKLSSNTVLVTPQLALPTSTLALNVRAVAPELPPAPSRRNEIDFRTSTLPECVLSICIQ